MSNLQLEDAFRSAFAEMEKENTIKSSELNSGTRSKSQMTNYLVNLDWSDKQLETLIDAASTLLNERQEKAKKADRVQTYKAKLINLSKELDMSYQELLVTMNDLESRAKN